MYWGWDCIGSEGGMFTVLVVPMRRRIYSFQHLIPYTIFTMFLFNLVRLTGFVFVLIQMLTGFQMYWMHQELGQHQLLLAFALKQQASAAQCQILTSPCAWLPLYLTPSSNHSKGDVHNILADDVTGLDSGICDCSSDSERLTWSSVSSSSHVHLHFILCVPHTNSFL